MQFDEGKFCDPIDGDQEKEPALLGLNLRDVDMEVAERIGLELPPGRGVAFDIG